VGIKQSDLVHYREVMYEGDEENRKTLRRISRPKRRVNHMRRQHKLMTVYQWEIYISYSEVIG